jgi:hypothetical protein
MEVERRNYVRMLESGLPFALSQKAPLDVGVPGILTGQEFHRRKRVENRISGFPDLGHSALTELFFKDIGA